MVLTTVETRDALDPASESLNLLQRSQNLGRCLLTRLGVCQVGEVHRARSGEGVGSPHPFPGHHPPSTLVLQPRSSLSPIQWGVFAASVHRPE